MSLTSGYRIGIDCRLAGSRHAGIGRYTANLVRELLLTTPDSITWVLFFSDKTQQAEIVAIIPKNVEVVIAPIRHYSLSEQLKMPGIFKAAKLDLLHVPHFNIPLAYTGKLIVTIHDLLWHEQRGSTVTTLAPAKYWLKYFFYHLIVWKAVHSAQKILVPAATIAGTVSRYYPGAKQKIVITPEGIDQSFLDTLIGKRRQPQSDALELVYTGSLYPHKNIEVVLQLLQQYPDIHLTIVGSRSVFRDQVEQRCKELSVQYQVTFAGYLPDEKLCDLYSVSDVLIQPSLSEGFGLTGLEALSQNLPVIVSDIPIFREIYQNAAVFFNPHDPVSVYEALLETLKKQTELLQNSKKLLPRYSWKLMANQTLNTYLQILEKK